jgi:DNA-directed RNA polymerase subunit RPC12/RpoP
LVILVEHVCDRCGGQFESSELNTQDKQILDSSGKWMRERTYRCYDCEKEALLGQGAP